MKESENRVFIVDSANHISILDQDILASFYITNPSKSKTYDEFYKTLGIKADVTYVEQGSKEGVYVANDVELYNRIPELHKLAMTNGLSAIIANKLESFGFSQLTIEKTRGKFSYRFKGSDTLCILDVSGSIPKDIREQILRIYGKLDCDVILTGGTSHLNPDVQTAMSISSANESYQFKGLIDYLPNHYVNILAIGDGDDPRDFGNYIPAQQTCDNLYTFDCSGRRGVVGYAKHIKAKKHIKF